jgi:hypothetical protein
MAVSTAPLGLSPDDAALIIGCTPDHVRLLCRRGLLTAVRVRQRWFVDPDSARRYSREKARELHGDD